MIPFGDRDDGFADADLVHHLVMDWRVRCAARRAPWELTTGHPALALCVAAVRTLEQGVAPAELALSVRTWGAGVPSPEGARAALQCLGEAVSDLVVSGFGEFRPRGLDLVLQELAKEAVIPAGRRTVPLDLDALTRCPDRRALERDLATVAAAARATGEDVTVAVMAIDVPRPRALRLVGSAEPSEDAQLLALLATLRTTFGSSVTVYRVGERTFAVLAPGVGAVAMGESILLATCRPGPAFAWGTASLQALAATTAGPDLLLLLAEADLHVRHEDEQRAKSALTHQRQLSVVSAVAAALLVLAGAAVGLSGATGHHQPAQEASRAPRVGLPAPSGSPVPTTAPPAAVPPAAPPSATPPPANAGSATVPGAGAAPTSPPASNTVLASFQTPAPAAAAPSPPPPPPPPPPSGTTKAAPGNSGKAPGHLKVNGASIKHA